MGRSSTTFVDEASWLAFERAPGETLRAALERTLREAILAGSLRPGVALPGSRALAAQLGVSRGVVSDAYAQLEAQGYLVGRPRVGCVVGAIPPPPVAQREELRAAAPRFDLTPTTPDVTLFPLRRWLSAIERSARQFAPAVLDYREPRGEGLLRSVLADRLGRTRGNVADPAQIVIVQGTAQGIDLLLRLLSAQGLRSVAVEDPSHTTQHERIRGAGLTLVAQPVDADALVVDGLEAEAVLVTPAHQFPLGTVMSGPRRRALLAWASAGGRLIIEDDYDSEFRYDRDPVRSLQGLASEHVVQLGTVSKTLAPALRLGWLVAPPHLVDEAQRAKRLLDDFTPALDQLTLAEFMRSGDYDRHLRQARAAYRKRRDRLLAAFATHLPELPIGGVAAGLHIVVELPRGVNDAAVAAKAARLGVRVPPLSSFTVNPSDRTGLVVGYGRLHESAITLAVKTLASAVRADPAS